MEPLDGDAPPLSERYRRHLVAAGLVAFTLIQQPGRLVGDTKADLVTDPTHFLAKAVQAWNAGQGFGQLGNQSYGYLFPMGPLFALGHLAAVPAWLIQRLWWAAVLLVAYYGVLRLAEAMAIGTSGSRIVGALAYAAAPRVLTVLGGISVEAWPGAVAPWVLLPLVLAGAGRLSPRRGAALSALGVAATGAVNAAATVGVLVLPAVFLVVGVRGPLQRRLLLRWVLFVALAILWWAGPLFILGRYAFPFLDYIENASTTTLTTDVLTTLRGAEHWGGYLLVGSGPRWPAGFDLSFGSPTFLATCMLAAAGLAGLCRSSLPQAGWLRSSACVGLVVICAGHAGHLGGGLSSDVQSLLDGAFAAMRNVHKFDPVLRLPLALGLTHLLGDLLAGRRQRGAVEPFRLGRRRMPQAHPASTATAAILLALSGSLLPGLQDGVSPPGSYKAVPAYWSDVARWLAARSTTGSALLVPASPFAVYTWGSPQDEPLQSLARSPWEVRDAVPLGAPGAYRVLDGIDALLDEGRPSEQLAPAVARLGIRFLVLRNDLDAEAAGATEPPVVRAALVGSPGIEEVATFGARRPTSRDPTADTVLPEVEIFGVSGVVPALTGPASAIAVGGGPEATVAGADALTGRAAVLDQDVGPATPVAGLLITDTARRRALDFSGTTSPRYSPTLPASADPKGTRPAAELGPEAQVDEQTVSAVEGLTSVSASTSASDPFNLAYRSVADRPEAAFDGDPATAWVSGGPRATGEWISAQLTHAIRADHVTVRMVDDKSVGPSVAQLRIRTDSGSRLDTVAPGRKPQVLALPPGPTETVRLTVTAVRGTPSGAGVGIAEITFPGLVTTPKLETARTFPPAVTGLPTAIELSRSGGDRSGCIAAPVMFECGSYLAQAGEEIVPYLREVRTPGPVGPSVKVTVRAAGDDGRKALQGAVERATGVVASASSSAVHALADSALAAADGDLRSVWVPAADDPAPRLKLHFDSSVVAHTVTFRGQLAAAKSVVLAAGGRTVTLRPASGVAQPIALSGNDWTITLVRSAEDSNRVAVPLRLAEVFFNGAPVASSTVTLPCGSGPSVVIDGREQSLAITASVADVLGGAEVPAQACSPALPLPAGNHRVQFRDAAGWQVTSVGLGLDELPAGKARTVAIRVSTDSHLAAQVSSGPPAYLQLTQSFNAGWRARVGHTVLTPVRLDGWRQGFLLPASRSPVAVSITFVPQRWQTIVLGAGAGALALLGMIAVLPEAAPLGSVGRLGAPARGRRRVRPVGRLATVALLGWLIAGPVGAVAGVATTLLPAARQWVVAGGGMTLAGVSGVLFPSSSLAELFAVVAATALVSSTMRPGQTAEPDRAPAER